MLRYYKKAIVTALAFLLTMTATPLRAQDAKPLCTAATRACFAKTAQAYFDGILKADGAAVPFASDVRVTEQGRVVVTSRAAFLSEFKASGPTKAFRNIRMVFDEKAGEVAIFMLADVQFDGQKPYTLRRTQRMKIVKGLITEVELILYEDDDNSKPLWPGR